MMLVAHLWLYIAAFAFSCFVAALSHSSTYWFFDKAAGVIKNEPNPVVLSAPDDLITFLKYEKKKEVIFRVIETPAQKQQKQLEQEREEYERKLFFADPDCKITQKKLSGFDLYLSSFLRLEVKGIKIEDYLDYQRPLPADSQLEEPFCTAEVLFSMKTYDHLKGVSDRYFLANTSEYGLTNPIPQAKMTPEFGQRIKWALDQNPTSWVALNLAAIYWRVTANAAQAVECLRRALHYSPRQHKDLALVSLANVLHRSKYSLDAAILMHAALETTSDYDIVYFTLGNIYGALGQFDLAELCYKYVADLQPDFEAAKLRMHAARCEFNMDAQMAREHKTGKDITDGLEELRVKEQLIEDQKKESVTDRSTPLRQHNIYVAIQTPMYERDRLYASCEV